jgi:hypothetical protein
MRTFLCLFSCLFSATLFAENLPLESLPSPVLPPSASGDESFEPEVRIIKRKGEIVHEYRVNGQLYMVKVVPASGPSYYLVDQDGDGSLDSPGDQLDPMLVVPRWVIRSW